MPSCVFTAVWGAKSGSKPWNPNRLEQRFGRIHRIGQTEVCFLWNLVASETREYDVYYKLLDKLAEAREALGGQVFDVLGKLLFEGKSLRDLLIEAVRYGDQPEVCDMLNRVVENALDRHQLEELLEEHVLVHDIMDASRVRRIREDMERAEARRLQPHYIESFFVQAFTRLGGIMRQREPQRYELTHVPAIIRNRDRIIGIREPVLPRYERATFEKALIAPPGQPLAAFICPGSPLLDSVIDLTLERNRDLLKRGAARHIHYAPYLNFRPLAAEEPTPEALLSRPECAWITKDMERTAQTYAVTSIVPEHLAEVKQERLERITKTEAAVKDRLTKEINYWDHRAEELRAQEQADHPNARLNSGEARKRADLLQGRLQKRLEELKLEAQIAPLPPVIQGGFLVVPIGLIRAMQGKAPVVPGQVVDTQASGARARAVVMDIERSLGFDPVDREFEKLGYDVESRVPGTGKLRFIEVKGRVSEASSINVTRNEVLYSLNKPEDFILAIVEFLDETNHRVHYIRHPLQRDLWWARRPLAAARAVIFSQMVDDPSAHPDLFPTEKAQEKERQRQTCAANADHPRARELFDRNKLPAFHDPFAGGGALPLEAQRLGLESYASDLNPVAVLINKAMIEIPPKFAGKPPVNPVTRG